MGRLHYMVDRARIFRSSKKVNKGVVTKLDAAAVGNLIPCRLRTLKGAEQPAMAQTYLGQEAQLVLSCDDVTGTRIVPRQSDEFEIQFSSDDTLSTMTARFKIVGRIEEIRRNTILQSYVIPVRMDTEI